MTYGFSLLTVKETPALLAKNKISLAKGLYQWSVKRVVALCFISGLLVAFFISVGILYLHLFKITPYTLPILLALVAVPFYGVMNYYIAALRGNFKVVLALLPDNIVKSFILLLAVGILYIFYMDITISRVIGLNILSFGIAALFAVVTFYRNTGYVHTKPEYEQALWKKSLRAFFLLTLIMTVNSCLDILLLAYFKNASQVGIYSAADMLASKLATFLLITNQVSASFISKMHSLEQQQKLQQTITKITRWVMVISLPVYLIFVVFSKWIMLYFGPDFVQGQVAFIILSSGQLISIAFGPVGNFSLMTGNQQLNIIFAIIGILINIALNFILTPILGLNGTAIATTVALVTWNAGMYIATRKKTGIRTWIFG